MPVNPNIPLQARGGIDISQGINSLSNAIQFKQQKERQATLDTKTNEVNDLKIQQIKQQIAGTAEEQSLKDLAVDSIKVRSLLESNDIEGARNFTLDRISKLNERRKTNPEINTVQSEQFLQLLESDPNQAMQVLNGEIKGLEQLGFIKPATTVKPLSELGKARSDLNTGLINQGDFDSIIAKESGLKSPEQIQQLVEFERLKTQAKRNEPAEKLKLEKLQADIDAKKLKIQEGDQQKEKAGKLKTTAVRLIDDLLKNPDSVRSIVGPFDQSFLSPTLFGESLKSQTKINQLKSIMTAENLGIMTGVLSETDIKIIAQIAGGGLDVDGDDDAFIAELQRMRDSLSAEIGQQETQEVTEGATATNPQTGQTIVFRNGQWQEQ